MGDLTLFDYASIPAETVTEVRAAAERIRVRMKRTVEDIIAIGLDLIAVKERLPHGAFLPWIEAEFGMAGQTARRFMQVAETYGGKSNIMLNLPPTVLYELAAPSTPEPVREIAEQRAEAGKSVSVEEVKRLKRELANKDEATRRAERQAAQAAVEMETAKAERDRYRRQAETALDGQRELVAKAERDAAKKLAVEIEAAQAEADNARRALLAEQQKAACLVNEAKQAALDEARGRAEALAQEELAKRRDAVVKADADLKRIVADIERRKAALASIEAGIAMKQELDRRLSSVDYENREILKEAEEIIRLQALFMVTLDDVEYQNEHAERVRKVVAQLADQCGKLQGILANLYGKRLSSGIRVVEIDAEVING